MKDFSHLSQLSDKERHERIVELQDELRELHRLQAAVYRIDFEAVKKECLRIKKEVGQMAAVNYYRNKIGCGLLEARDVVFGLG